MITYHCFQENIERFKKAVEQKNIQFDCATRETGSILNGSLSPTQKTSTEQAWSIKDGAKADDNFKILKIVADTLNNCPEMHCKLHGSTDSERGDSDKNKALSAYFKRESTMQIQDELAQKRANACRNELVKLGIEKERLLVTWASCGEHSKVEFFPMESAEASAEKAIWKSKAAEAVNIFKSTVNDPISDTEHTVDRLRAKTCD